MFGVTTFALACALLPRALAHGGVLSYSIGGKWYDGWKAYNSPTGQSTIQRRWDTYNPIQDATDPTIGCNDDGSSSDGQQTASVAAGTAITAYWNTWPHNTGPIITYLAKCPGTTCTGVNSNTLKWFKIDQAGLLSGTVGNGQWAAGKMIAQNNSWTSTIPSSVPSGSYLIRFETIALHSMPAQFYPECAQIDITGSGSLVPTAAQLVSLPGAYSNSDPGVTIDIYGQAAQTQTTYVIPGPALYGSSGSGSPPAPPSSAPPQSTHPVSTSSAPAPTGSPSSGTVAHFGQCGGIGYSGPTGCVAPFVCTALNDYYSQCI